MSSVRGIGRDYMGNVFLLCSLWPKKRRAPIVKRMMAEMEEWLLKLE